MNIYIIIDIIDWCVFVIFCTVKACLSRPQCFTVFRGPQSKHAAGGRFFASIKICLVVYLPVYPSEKWWSSSVGIMTFPTEWKVKKIRFQSPPTRNGSNCSSPLSAKANGSRQSTVVVLIAALWCQVWRVCIWQFRSWTGCQIHGTIWNNTIRINSQYQAENANIIVCRQAAMMLLMS